jgi:protein-S-isoprenylcysteine O-methyltransferase Ste14
MEAIGGSGQTRDEDHGERWLGALGSLAVGAGFFALWFWLLPGWLGFQVDATGVAGWRWIAVAPSVLGFAVALRCVWDFGWTGHGTPMPLIPPSRLVVVGFYRYVRNPMYVGFVVGWVGLWVVFGRANMAAIGVACVVLLGLNLFVALYEEPTLRRMFGAEYEEYCRHVGRWVPRLHAWEQAKEH